MIAKLRGMVDALGADWAVIDVGGVGYHVTCSRRALDAMRVGSLVAVTVETLMREDRIQLFGFADGEERDWFRLLQTVQGVGARVAISILAALPSDRLAVAIAAGDKAALARADGVGPKLAGRIAAELKDKAGGIALGAGAPRQAAAATPQIGDAGLGDGARDAVSALVNLGYGRSEAFGAVMEARGQLGDQATVDQLIRAGLRALSTALVEGAR